MSTEEISRGGWVQDEGNWPFLAHLRGLVEEHEKHLVQCEQSFTEPTDATRWDARTDVVQLALGSAAHRSSHEELKLSVADVLGQVALEQNPSLFRITLCFTSVVEEMNALTREAEEVFMPALAVYDDLAGDVEEEDRLDDDRAEGGLGGPGAHSESASTATADAMGWRSTDAEVEAKQKALRQASRALTAFTRFLGTLEKMWAWLQHVQRVTRYVVQQLSALYPDEKSEAGAGIEAERGRGRGSGGGGDKAGAAHKRTLAHLSQRFLSEARLHLVWTSLGDMLRAVLALDEITMQNEAIVRGVSAVHEGLALMKADKDVLWVDERQEPSFRELIRTVERDVIGGRMLHRAVHQSFNDPSEHISVTANAAFQKEFMAVLQQQLNTIDAAFGTSREVENEARYASVLVLHDLLSAVCQKQDSASAPRATTAAATAELDLQRRTLTKRVFDLHTRLPFLHLHAQYVMFPGVWMASRAYQHQRQGTALARSLAEVEQTSMNAAQESCRRRATTLVPTMRRLTTLTATWIAAMESTLPVGPSHTRAFLQDTTLLLQRGVAMARDVQLTLVYLLLAHHATDMPMTVAEVAALSHGLQLLIQIRHTYHNKTGIIAAAFTTLVKSITHVMEVHLCAMASSIYTALEARQQQQDAARRAGGRGGPSVADSLRCQYDAITQAIYLVQSTTTPTETSLTALAVALDLAFNRLRLQTAATGESLIDPRGVDGVFIALSQLQRIAEYQRRVAHTTDCAFVFWQRHSLFPLFIRQLYQQPQNAPQTPLLLVALHDPQRILFVATHVRRPRALVAEYDRFVRQCIWTELIRPLCTDVENDLRLGTHAAVLGQPFRQLPVSTSETNTGVATLSATAAKRLSRFTRLAPFRVFGEWLHLRAAVEDYLDAQFYNLNALMPNDWETYEEMRQCALEWYGLELCSSHLPGTVMDQGLDVLAVTENIHVFIAHYTYNLDGQLFVQRPSSTTFKHLHTLHTRHIANSIRTHGTGIMNTAVNYVYRCLVTKLTTVSQFLYDDVVRSRLLKDAKLVAQSKMEGKPEYTLECAEAFVRDMQKIGYAQDGKAYLDKFRELVAEIGNALGYMRLVRSGGLRAVADAAAFTHPTQPAADTSTTSGFTAVDPSPTSPRDVSRGTSSAAAAPGVVTGGPCDDALSLVHGVSEEMRGKLSEGSDYFRLLLRSVGAKLQKEEKYRYLRLFYLIVPPMTLTFVDHLVTEKGKLTKQRKEGVFCDDGFALGCAFLIALFDVESSFDALHWFDTVRQHYVQKLEAIQKEMVESVERGRRTPAAGPDRSSATAAAAAPYADNEEERVHNMYLSLSMVDVFYKEYIALEETFLSSKILFYDSSSTVDATVRPDTEGGEGSDGALIA